MSTTIEQFRETMRQTALSLALENNIDLFNLNNDDKPDQKVVTSKLGIQTKDGSVNMEVLLQDLLAALGINVPQVDSQADWKRSLYEAAMLKVKELTATGGNMSQGKTQPQGPQGPQGVTPKKKFAPNPLLMKTNTEYLQTEQQPMYMSIMDRLATEHDRLLRKQRDIDTQLCVLEPAVLSLEDEDRISADMAKRMTGVLSQGDNSVHTEEDALVEKMCRFMCVT